MHRAQVLPPDWLSAAAGHRLIAAPTLALWGSSTLTRGARARYARHELLGQARRLALVLRLSGGCEGEEGVVGDAADEDSGESIPFSEAEGPELPRARDGPPPPKSFLKISDVGEIWVEKEGQQRLRDDVFDDAGVDSKVVETIDLGLDAECSCKYCTGEGEDGTAGCQRSASQSEAGELGAGGGKGLDMTPDLDRALETNLQALCRDILDSKKKKGEKNTRTADGCSTKSTLPHTGDSSEETAEGPLQDTTSRSGAAGAAQGGARGGAREGTALDGGLVTQPVAPATRSGEGWQFKGQWQVGTVEPAAQGARQEAGGGGCVEWEDGSDDGGDLDHDPVPHKQPPHYTVQPRHDSRATAQGEPDQVHDMEKLPKTVGATVALDMALDDCTLLTAQENKATLASHEAQDHEAQDQEHATHDQEHQEHQKYQEQEHTTQDLSAHSSQPVHTQARKARGLSSALATDARHLGTGEGGGGRVEMDDWGLRKLTAVVNSSTRMSPLAHSLCLYLSVSPTQ